MFSSPEKSQSAWTPRRGSPGMPTLLPPIPGGTGPSLHASHPIHAPATPPSQAHSFRRGYAKLHGKGPDALEKSLQQLTMQDEIISTNVLEDVFRKEGMSAADIRDALCSMPSNVWCMRMEVLREWLNHCNRNNQIAVPADVTVSGFRADRVLGPSLVPLSAEQFFHACESGKGWHECRHYCTHDASFSAQAEPVKDIKTVLEYTEWMKGIALIAMPGSSYELNSQSFDPRTRTATFFGTFHGTHTGYLEGLPAPTHKSMETQYVYSIHVSEQGQIDSITKVWHSAWAAAQVGWMPSTDVPAAAEHLFHACEGGQGWQGVMHYCTHDATFGAQAEPLTDIATVREYAEWMRGIAVVAMPGCSYELNAKSFDPETNTATFCGTFRGTHTGHLQGFPAPTHKSMDSQYVYNMHVNAHGNVDRITKVWHSAWCSTAPLMLCSVRRLSLSRKSRQCIHTQSG
eukprot:TRINITY_DN4432_c0_g1_i1.p1 TRINITY_DN4432_c0_g1~~TRINITY_DN4432_c0_g1_i1.p1  ORF type:complete len:474 (-),score=64.66 TRINITY_DN4432_c0_g1_i1:426-1799(-)